ncbi:OmpA family protein [Mesonia sp. MT50]|uniref:OmpA family protein n=1 Tax=Mesonia profundi TaxID=3070998 RepID=A0ABU1A5F8_9FLAO|nr:OmpA family protein [Mesonia profundi]MDQ7918041.1 OmpA family protein [Mesonia profundi]
MRKRYYIAAALLFMFSGVANAQKKSTKKADKHYDRLEYVEAIKDYEKLVSKGDADAYVYERLADSYYNLYNTKQAERYYKLHLKASSNASAEAHYRYAQMLKANKKFDASNAAMQDFASKAPNDERAKAFKANPDYLPQLLNGEPRFAVNKLQLNTSYQDFGAYAVGNKLYFVSARNKSRRDYGWNDQPTLDIYEATKKGDSYTDIKLLDGDVNSKYHEGTVSITPDGKTMFFTRNDYSDGDYEKDSNGIGQLKVYQAKLINGEWDDIQEVSFNDSEYSTGHTAISPDGKTLYFSSDMPGGKGMSDLYKVEIKSNGSFGSPQNLGAGINTEGREGFPFVDSEGTLYFSSDGQLGLGGLDVFYAKTSGDGFGAVKNVGQPVNSSGDDFAYSYDVEKETGFVSSNRGALEGKVANDNIYRVDQIQIVEEIMVASTVINEETGAEIANAQVVVYDSQENEIAREMTNDNGVANFTLMANEPYVFQVNAEDYESNASMVGEDAEGEVDLVIELSPIEKIIQEEEVVLNPIMFDFDKSNIRKQAAFELDKLVAVMKKYPEMKIKVEAHTDKRGAANYNQQLSERRAQSTVQYVISKGIDESRISGEGLGESAPKVDCDSCTEEQFELNRRSVFRIIEK